MTEDRTIFDEIASAVAGTATHRDAIAALEKAGFNAYAYSNQPPEAGSAITIMVNRTRVGTVAWVGGTTSKWHIYGPGERQGDPAIHIRDAMREVK